MLKTNWKMGFLIFGLISVANFASHSCKWFKQPTETVEPKWVRVEVKYQRVEDTPDCPRFWFDPKVCSRVNLEEFRIPNHEMEQIEEDLFLKVLPTIPVKYPKSDYGGYPHRIYVVDPAFDRPGQEGCEFRAHKMWFNGYKAPRDAIHYGDDPSYPREYLLVRFDEEGIPHFE